MNVKVIIECGNCGTYKEELLKEGKNVISGCSCPYPFGDDGGEVIVKSDKN